MPSTAISTATPIASPTWRSMLMTAEPVANACGGSCDVPLAISVGSVRPTPMPVSSIPPSISPAYSGRRPIATAHQATPAAKVVEPMAITRPAPRRAVSRPATRNENSATISGPGAIGRPVTSGDQCQTSCAHKTRESNIPPNEAANKIATADAPVNGLSRNSARSISASRLQAVCAANSASAAAATPSVATVLESPQPHVPPLTRPSDSRPTPRVTSSVARASGRETDWPGTCGSCRQPTTSASRPIGTLTKNTHRQLASTSSPPMTGPRAAAKPPAAVHVRTAPCRRSAGKLARTSPSEVGVSSAAPAACTTRNATNIGRLLAAPHAAEAATNSATPSRKPRSRG